MVVEVCELQGASRGDYDGKKTLAETRPTSGKNCAVNDHDDVKVKVSFFNISSNSSSH